MTETKIIESTKRDVKPADCGMIDESWFVAECEGGGWVAFTDHADQDIQLFASEIEAEEYWEEAATTERKSRPTA